MTPAQKAWKTRKRNAIPSKKMLEVLHFMNQVGGYLKVCHLNEKTYYAVRLCNSDHYISRCPRLTYSTYRAMKKRGWFEFSKKTHTGGRLGTLPNGTIDMVEQYFDMHYVLSEKARKMLQKISS